MLELLSLIILWCLISIIPVRVFGHAFMGYWKKIGLKSYIFIWIWVPIVAYLIWFNKDILLVSIQTHLFLKLIGLLILIGGISIWVWSGRKLGFRNMIAYREIKGEKSKKEKLMTKGPYSLVRHPIYFGEFLGAIGMFLISGVLSFIFYIIFWPAITYFITFFEEKGLIDKFGKEYRNYKKKVPRFFPD